jgi:hypothetical protein
VAFHHGTEQLVALPCVQHLGQLNWCETLHPAIAATTTNMLEQNHRNHRTRSRQHPLSGREGPGGGGDRRFAPRSLCTHLAVWVKGVEVKQTLVKSQQAFKKLATAHMLLEGASSIWQENRAAVRAP